VAGYCEHFNKSSGSIKRLGVATDLFLLPLVRSVRLDADLRNV
jgi:hypothetical protein